ncbi:Cache 3/Cache 2 fusion domain-containing protein [Clostridium sp. ZS2-4]|uniref:Cache 3/Cache 2 fusion domain-containing protein n=1 Tax=Clostridium sp. ZS2-4 TaxID=2987703 RepID=UPI00227AA32F|nr:Cache 3/Cache 2 fusion domain-containing protein [Clostridium sp. ZS2-4]MCY6354575.1 Cache 3/Cache 2 fusion domain-containing protein [Clostridium sp. ZS2-4]
MTIKRKMIISYLLLIVFSVSILGVITIQNSRKVVFNEVTEKSRRITDLINTTISVRNDLLSKKVWSDLHFAEKLLDNCGKLKIDNSYKIQIGNFRLPCLYAGNTNLSLSTTLIDDIKTSTDAVASIFLLKDEKLIRISTNVMKNGKRATGTYIPSSSPVYKSITNNKPFYGRTPVEEDWYITGYKPLLDKNGTIIGAIALGYAELNNFLEKTLLDIKIGETGYVYIINSKGDVLLHPNLKGENATELDFCKKITKNKNGIINYTFSGVHKLAAYRYYEPYTWYIVTTANYDDLQSSSKSLLYTTILVGLLTLLISTILAILFANTIVNPINKLKNCMEVAGNGDLLVQCDIKSKDEIGVLSQSFNNLIRENKRLLEETIEYDRLKTEFFSNVSHELKTPLNIIFSTTQLLALYCQNHHSNLEITPKVNNYINIMKQNCYRLLKLVNNLIDITKIDSGFIKLNLKTNNIVEVIENVTLSTVEYVESKSRTIIFDTDIEEKIMAFDPEKIERIILNLISNAIKFTKPQDKIEVTIYDKKESIIISVKDTGIGIPKEKQEIIFERFRQASPLLNRNHEGSGIGLSLVKSLVEMHDGKISLDSEYGKGTKFIIELPVKLIAQEYNTEIANSFTSQINVEKILIEFSDIYS